ncbi:hypothetical protein BOS5A_230241 [Bosea sp. EC-HK365B]|nr:hypothetical protein BOSE7B_60348 [Bosea sp. 7B]VVT60965.1 hypothetical protein BOS5A_230241 [Bosea sp. EC-HK365B]VXB34515.1 hypothetical protein BOSE127_110346 [Bosea sp. 127]
MAIDKLFEGQLLIQGAQRTLRNLMLELEPIAIAACLSQSVVYAA